MDKERTKSILESLLFINERPLEMSEFLETLEVNKKEILLALDELSKEYRQRNSGICIVNVAGGYQMCSSPENETWVKKMYQERTKQKLSTAALETLAITAYKQPITRVEIEAIRGVNVDGVVRKLTDLGLIKIGGRKDVVGKPFLYITTRKFLEYFGINTLKDLPKLEEFAALADKDINQTIENANRQVEGVEEKSEEVKGVGNQEKENKEEDNIEGEVVNKEIEVGKNNKEI
tara:strand:- start:82 stop:783 length:702 start_codon:yes stop_codon:yes gene_type:complete